MKHYKVYIEIDPYAGMTLNVMAPDPEEAKLQAQKVMRKRFHLELGRDYKITKAIIQ